MLKREWAWVKKIWAGPTQSPGITPGLVTSRRFGPKRARFLDRLAPVRKARPDQEEILQNDVVTVGLKTTPEPPRTTSFQLPIRTPLLPSSLCTSPLLGEVRDRATMASPSAGPGEVATARRGMRAARFRGDVRT